MGFGTLRGLPPPSRRLILLVISVVLLTVTLSTCSGDVPMLRDSIHPAVRETQGSSDQAAARTTDCLYLRGLLPAHLVQVDPPPASVVLLEVGPVPPLGPLGGTTPMGRVVGRVPCLT